MEIRKGMDRCLKKLRQAGVGDNDIMNKTWLKKKLWEYKNNRKQRKETDELVCDWYW